jgi:hypothetical protein
MCDYHRTLSYLDKYICPPLARETFLLIVLRAIPCNLLTNKLFITYFSRYTYFSYNTDVKIGLQDDDSDLEYEVETFPAVSGEASIEAAASVKVC